MNLNPFNRQEPEPADPPVEPIDPPAEPAPQHALSDEEIGRIVGGVKDAIVTAAVPPKQEGQAVDPYDEIASLIFTDPAAALKLQSELTRKETMDQMMPFVAPVANAHATARVTDGLTPEGVKYAEGFMKEKGINPQFLQDDTIADLVRSKALLFQREQADKHPPIPSTESATAYGNHNVDAETSQSLSGLERVYKDLGLKFDAGKILGRLR
jgi:hypothetical protein